MIGLVLLFAALCNDAAAVSDEGNEVCLLNLRHRVDRVAVDELGQQESSNVMLLAVEKRRNALGEWANENRVLRAQIETGPTGLLRDGGLDTFIAAQAASGDACHSKMLEAKRSLDALQHQVHTLSLEIEAENEVMEGNTGAIKDALDAKKGAEDGHAAANKACEAASQESKDTELEQLAEELKEMEQMADPEVRSHVAHDVDYRQRVKTHVAHKRLEHERNHVAQETLSDEEVAAAVDNIAVEAAGEDVAGEEATGEAAEEDVAGEEEASLLARSQTLILADASKMCDKFRSLVDRITHKHSLTLKSPDCNQTRAALQTEYTTAYLAIGDLYNRKVVEIAEEEKVCKEAAQAAFNEREAAIKEEIKVSTNDIASAKDTIESLNPLLEESKISLAKLEMHINTMKNTCEIDTSVSAHLKNIRSLIHNLEACPGRNDFQLSTPEFAKDDVDKAIKEHTAKPPTA